MKRYAKIGFISFLSLAAGIASLARAPLTFDERVKAQEAIERVYYNHRIWPKENPQPKPPFEEMVPGAVIEAKVTDCLKKCAALEKFWQSPIAPEQLQAEMDRMAAGTRDAAVLQELFEALGNDPLVIGECLARPTLADRLIRNWYSSKTGFEAWWNQESAGLAPPPAILAPDAPRYRLPVISPASGEITRGDAWVSGALQGEIDPRTSHSAVWTGSEMIVWGGADTNTNLHNGGRYNPATDSWLATSSGTNCPTERTLHTAVWTGTEMIVWGGWKGNIDYWNDGGRYNPTSDSWLPVSTSGSCPAGRYGHTAVWTGTKMIVWGGRLSCCYYTNTGGIYTPASDSWVATSTGTDCPEARSRHTAVWTGSKMIIWGGEVAWVVPTDSGGIFDPETNGWTATPTGANCPSPRIEHTSVWSGSEMLVFGGGVGVDSGYMGTGARFDPVAGTWTAMSTGPGVPAPRAFHSAVWTGTEMIVWGGLDLDDGGRYTPASDTWVAIPSGSGAPSIRHDHTAVWTGTQMIVWGGTIGCPNCGGPDDAFNTGGRYNPSTGTWTPTATGDGAPEARSHHTAVFTGSEMLVWGGVSYLAFNPNYLKTGGRYTPATDSWTPTATSGSCPTERYDHTAVWTGSEMVVWGGEDFPQDGGRYNPVTNVWKATSTAAGCPSGRIGHTAIWTGSLMVIWGGFALSGPHAINDGGQYNPSTDVWQATGTGTNCPAARGYHTAIWTGGRMIVWGGAADNQVYFADGGQYDPSTKSWTHVPTAPYSVKARYSHSAVWTGEVMIVWGGDSSDLPYPDAGAFYNPYSSLWTVASTGADCPHGRTGHTAVWTGNRMLVWGGEWVDNGTIITNEGGLFDPQLNHWGPLAVSPGVPTPRSCHSAVWAGSSMMVWGGWPQTATGGIYHMTSAPPCAVLCSASAAPTSGSPPLAVSFSASATPNNCSGGASYVWTFGDGANSTQQNPSHTYSTAGTFTWTMTASASGATCAKTGTITVAPPCALTCTATATPTSGTAPLQVSFTSTATPTNCTGSPTFAWTFGDSGGSSSQNPSHTYANPGTYTWTMTATVQGIPCSKTGTITVSAPCTMTCSATVPGSAKAGEMVSFQSVATASHCTGTPSFAWSFGDGGSEAVQNPTHTYADAGTYTWTLTVTVDGKTCSKTGSITVGEPCTLTCTATAPATGRAGDALAFSSTAEASHCSGTPVFSWNFGDGGTSAEQNPTHTYTSTGNFAWTLTVTADGKTCSKTGMITVGEPCALTCTATAPVGGRAGDALAFSSTAEASHCSGTPAFSWTFGDGATSAEQNPTHTYAATGSFPWTLTVTVDDQTCNQAGTVAVSEGCSVSCTASATPASGEAPLTVSFAASATPFHCDGPPAFAWVFGDGATSTEPNPSHTYTAPGTFSWTMTVTVEGRTCTQTGTVTVVPPCVLACDATATPDHGAAPLAVAFAATVEASDCPGSPTFLWSFGDGETSSEPNPAHTYAAPSTYAWSCTVTAGGKSCSASGSVTVSPGLPGDANNDGIVSIGEVQQAINMFLEVQPPGNGADCNGDGSVSIGEVQKVINAFLGLPSSC